MAIIVNGVSGKNQWENLRKGADADGPWVTLQYVIDNYSQADAFLDGCLGGYVKAGGTGGSVKYVPRQKCPTNPTLYARTGEIDFLGPIKVTAGGLPQFGAAIVSINYGVLPWPQAFSDDPGGEQSFPNEINPGEPYTFADCEIDYGGEFVTIPKGSLVFHTSPKLTVDAPLGMWVGMNTYRFTRHNYPNLPHAKVSSMVNKINQTKLFGQNKGQVRFDGAKTKFTSTTDGTKCQLFEMQFSVRQYDWNYYIRPDSMVFDIVEDPNNSIIHPYTYTDLSGLLS